MVGVKVLIVDDNEIDRILDCEIIAQHGIKAEIHEAFSGRDALKALNHFDSHKIKMPDVILLDINMPELNGFEFLQEFNKSDLPDKAAIKIVMLTSSENHQDMHRAEELGIKHYLTKPLDGVRFKSILSER